LKSISGREKRRSNAVEYGPGCESYKLGGTARKSIKSRNDVDGIQLGWQATADHGSLA
jgi:hypothetical protein